MTLDRLFLYQVSRDLLVMLHEHNLLNREDTLAHELMIVNTRQVSIRFYCYQLVKLNVLKQKLVLLEFPYACEITMF